MATGRILIWLFITVSSLSSTSFGQGTKADYDRSDNLEYALAGSVSHAWVNPHWSADGNTFWYQSHANKSYKFVWVDALTGRPSPAFDESALAIVLGEAMGQWLDPGCLPIDGIESHTKTSIVIDVDRKRWRVSLPNYAVTALRGRAPYPSAIKHLSAIDAFPSANDADNSAELTITFVNQTSKPILLYFVDQDGNTLFGQIAAGVRREVSAFRNTVWLVTDSNGTTLGIFKTNGDGGDAIIDDSTANLSTTMPAMVESDNQVISPDGQWAAFTQDYNVYLRNLKTGNVLPLSQDGADGDGYDDRFLWSPNSAKLAALRVKAGKPEVLYLEQFFPRREMRPIIDPEWYYRPGDPIPLVKPHLFDIGTAKEIPVSDKLFPNPFRADISDLCWDPNSSKFHFDYRQRGCQEERIIDIDANDGAANTLLDEKSKTFIDYSKSFVYYLDATREMIWASERDGWNHLYLFDSRTGRLKNQITKGAWIVRSWDPEQDWVDPKQRQIWFRASGIVRGQNPYYVHYCRINLDGTGLIDFTPENATHQVEYSPNRRFYVDTYSRLNLPPISQLKRTSDGTVVCSLENADVHQLLAAGWKAPESFVAKGQDGVTDIYGVIYRPIKFDPSRKYPVIDLIYGGPQDSYVPTAFTIINREMELAELGFIVVQVDGMGTNNRSKRFHDACWRNLGDAGLPDHILWIKAAAAKYRYMDLSRVGIMGGSEGGQNAVRALEAFGNFYKVAAAVCGCYDNRLSDLYWTEQWMGWPIGPWYAQQSDVTNAALMKGKLLLIGCEMDKVVDPAETMQMANALVNANKDFDLIMIPNARHGAIGDYGERRLADFFVRHLMGVEPPAW